MLEHYHIELGYNCHIFSLHLFQSPLSGTDKKETSKETFGIKKAKDLRKF